MKTALFQITVHCDNPNTDHNNGAVFFENGKEYPLAESTLTSPISETHLWGHLADNILCKEYFPKKEDQISPYLVLRDSLFWNPENPIPISNLMPRHSNQIFETYPDVTHIIPVFVFKDEHESKHILFSRLDRDRKDKKLISRRFPNIPQNTFLSDIVTGLFAIPYIISAEFKKFNYKNINKNIKNTYKIKHEKIYNVNI